MISILDYGVGNPRAVLNMYKRIGMDANVVSKPSDLRASRKIILPGVGAFDYAMQRFNESGLRDSIERLILLANIPVLGICVGMQMLCKSSSEGVEDGLGWINTGIEKFSFVEDYPVPHMGWNKVDILKDTALNRDLEKDARFYFAHSYYLPAHPSEFVVMTTNYSNQFASAINQDNIYGVQFHPEKSHRFGLGLLKNFGEI
jgi:glutamine amidotransferase